MKRFDNKVALVTGGRSGIGQAIARRLRDEGARVFTAQRGKDDEFECFSIDLCDPAISVTAVEGTVRQAGRLDVLINNAGMMQEALGCRICARCKGRSSISVRSRAWAPIRGMPLIAPPRPGCTD